MKAARDSWVNPLLAVALCAGTGAAFAVLIEDAGQIISDERAAARHPIPHRRRFPLG